MREISFWQFSNKSEILFGLELHTIHMLCTKKLMNFADNDCDQQKFARSWELQCMKTAFIDSCEYKIVALNTWWNRGRKFSFGTNVIFWRNNIPIF